MAVTESHHGYNQFVLSGMKESGLSQLLIEIAPGDFGLSTDTLFLLDTLKTAFIHSFVAAEKMAYTISPLSADGTVASMTEEQRRFSGLFALEVFTTTMSEALSERMAVPNVDGMFELDGLMSLASQTDEMFPLRVSRLLVAYIRNEMTETQTQVDSQRLVATLYAFALLLSRTIGSVVQTGRYKRYLEQVAHTSLNIGGRKWRGFIAAQPSEAPPALRPVGPDDIIGNDAYLQAAMRLARDVAGYDFKQQANPLNINPIIFALGPPGCGKTLVAHAVGNYFTRYCEERNIPSRFVIIRKTDWASSYQNASAANLVTLFKSLYQFNGVVGIYWADIDTALASRDQKSLRSEEKANLSSAFNIFDGTLIPFDGKWFMMCDANNLDMDEALRTRIAQNPYNANGPETPKQYVQLFRDIQLKKFAPHIDCTEAQWMQIGERTCENRVSGRAMEGLSKKIISLIQDFEYPEAYYSADWDEKQQIISSRSKTVSGGKILKLVDDYIQFEKAEESRLAKQRFDRAVEDAVFTLNVQKEAAVKELYNEPE